MKLSKQTKDSLRTLSIITVADRLGMKLYGMGKLKGGKTRCDWIDG